jgi:hypothetical protein
MVNAGERETDSTEERDGSSLEQRALFVICIIAAVGLLATLIFGLQATSFRASYQTEEAVQTSGASAMALAVSLANGSGLLAAPKRPLSRQFLVTLTNC